VPASAESGCRSGKACTTLRRPLPCRSFDADNARHGLESHDGKKSRRGPCLRGAACRAHSSLGLFRPSSPGIAPRPGAAWAPARAHPLHRAAAEPAAAPTRMGAPRPCRRPQRGCWAFPVVGRQQARRRAGTIGSGDRGPGPRPTGYTIGYRYRREQPRRPPRRVFRKGPALRSRQNPSPAITPARQRRPYILIGGPPPAEGRATLGPDFIAAAKAPGPARFAWPPRSAPRPWAYLLTKQVRAGSPAWRWSTCPTKGLGAGPIPTLMNGHRRG